MAKYEAGDTIKITESFKYDNDWILKQEASIRCCTKTCIEDELYYELFLCKLYGCITNSIVQYTCKLIPVQDLEAHSELVKSEIDPELQKILDSGNLDYAIDYANRTRKRVPEVEKMIVNSGNPEIAYVYVRLVAKERVPEIEQMIIESGYVEIAKKYLLDVASIDLLKMLNNS